MQISKEEMRKLQRLRDDYPYFAEHALKIKTKDSRLAPFQLNKSQMYLHQKCEHQLKTTGKVRVIVVKGRQSGVSTYTGGRYYHKTSINRAINTFILSHEAATTDKLFKMVKIFHEGNPYAPIAAKSNARELDFAELSSQYYVGTAGSGDVGRGGTVHLFHGSEVGMWKNTDEIETGLMESIPEMRGTEIILESTAKGMGNYFHRMTMDALQGKNGYEVVFLPWHWMDEYEEETEGFTRTDEEEEYAHTFLGDYPRDSQDRKLAWRRLKIARYGSDWKFMQEYPSTVTEAFQTSNTTLIRSEDIMRARKNTLDRHNNPAPLVIGVDPARTGDRTAVVFRRGRILEEVRTFDEMDEMRLANIIAGYIAKYEPVSVNIDCTNSCGTYDRLVELGYRNVRNIHFASKAMNDTLYANKRAEMWCLLRDWMKEEVDIPDCDELHVDLTSVPDHEETDGKIRLVKKAEIKKILGMSPDIGDAAALTFAVRVNTALRTQAVKIVNKGLTKR